MIERDTRKLLIKALNKTGDNPEDVSCVYSRSFLSYDGRGGPVPMMPQCSAADLPEGELFVLHCHSKKYNYKLVKTGKGPQIKIRPQKHSQRA